MSTAYQVAQGTFSFNNWTSSDYGLWIEGGGTYKSPPKKVKKYSIPGRNGSVVIDEGAFEDVEHSYTCFIASSFNTNIQLLRQALTKGGGGYKRLTDTYHADEYYRARYVRGIDPNVAPRAVGAKLEIVFERDPRRFLTSGETTTTLTAAGTITNPTVFQSQPLLRVYGSGQLTVNSNVITIESNNYAYIDIDCELMDCYNGSSNANSLVSFNYNNFPKLNSGTNSISFTSGITKVVITPNWWRI